MLKQYKIVGLLVLVVMAFPASAMDREERRKPQSGFAKAFAAGFAQAISREGTQAESAANNSARTTSKNKGEKAGQSGQRQSEEAVDQLLERIREHNNKPDAQVECWAIVNEGGRSKLMEGGEVLRHVSQKKERASSAAQMPVNSEQESKEEPKVEIPDHVKRDVVVNCLTGNGAELATVIADFVREQQSGDNTPVVSPNATMDESDL